MPAYNEELASAPDPNVTFTLDDLMALDPAERARVVGEAGLSEEDAAKAMAPAPDPDLEPVDDPDAPEEPEAQTDEPEPEAAAPEQVEPPPAITPLEVTPAAPAAPAPDIEAIRAKIAQAEADQDALIARYDDLEVTAEEFRAQNRAILAEVAAAQRELALAEAQQQTAQTQQQQSDEAWFRMVGDIMQAEKIEAGTPRIAAFDAIVRRYEDVRPDLSDADKLQTAVQALNAVEAAGIDGRHFGDFAATLARIEASPRGRTLTEAQKIASAISAYAPMAEAMGIPIRLPAASNQPQAQRPERPAAPPNIGNLPAESIAGPSDHSRTGEVMQSIMTRRLDPIEAERMMASIPESQWDRETRAMPGNNYMGNDVF